VKAAWIYKIPRTWWIRFIVVSSAKIWFTFFNFQILIILLTHLVWFLILAHITHTCEARCSIQFARAVNKTINWYGSYFKDTILETASFTVHLGEHVEKFSRIWQVTCIFCTVAHEEDYEYGRINDTKSRVPLFAEIEIIPEMYWVWPYVLH
jgi:hypothetical protein